MAGDGQPLILRELSGDRPRTVILSGPDIPNRPIIVGGEMRIVESWYPGTEEASVQVMGTKEEPIRMDGILNDVLTGTPGGALLKRDEVQALRLRQRRLKMTWGTTIDVEGYLQATRFNLVRDSLIPYEFVFFVSLGDQAEAIAVTPLPQATESALVDEIDESLDFIETDTPAVLALLDSVEAVI